MMHRRDHATRRFARLEDHYISRVEVLQLYSNITRGCVIVLLYIFPYGVSTEGHV